MKDQVKIAIDAMGGENSPKKIIDGIKIYLKKQKNSFFILYGDENIIRKHFKSDSIIEKYCKIVHIEEKVLDDESPLTAIKKGNKTSMWRSIESQKDHTTDISLSAGNTGAMLVMSKMILDMIEGIDKPALAGLWPNKDGMNVVLDLGANIECNEKNLIDFSNMGAALFKSLYQDKIPKVALLNIGQEEIKGKDMLKKSFTFLKENKNIHFDFYGYIEGNKIMSGDVDVIITDGFTGNVALKTAEGTANFITSALKSSLNKVSLLLSYFKFNKLRNKLDPRKYNGAIFLGLKGPVVKSHGSTDALGFAYSIEMCNKIVKGDLIKKIQNNLNNIDVK